jgi:hypothetical protein
MGKLISDLIMQERMVWIHRKGDWVATCKTILSKKIEYVILLVEPQLPGGAIALELHTKILGDWS